MKSEWRVQVNYCCGDIYYQVYRIRDVTKTDHSGNREHKGGLFDSESEAQKFADKLNEEGK